MDKFEFFLYINCFFLIILNRFFFPSKKELFIGVEDRPQYPMKISSNIYYQLKIVIQH